jgi:hypothetical protein
MYTPIHNNRLTNLNERTKDDNILSPRSTNSKPEIALRNIYPNTNTSLNMYNNLTNNSLNSFNKIVIQQQRESSPNEIVKNAQNIGKSTNNITTRFSYVYEGSSIRTNNTVNPRLDNVEKSNSPPSDYVLTNNNIQQTVSQIKGRQIPTNISMNSNNIRSNLEEYIQRPVIEVGQSSQNIRNNNNNSKNYKSNYSTSTVGYINNQNCTSRAKSLSKGYL